MLRHRPGRLRRALTLAAAASVTVVPSGRGPPAAGASAAAASAAAASDDGVVTVPAEAGVAHRLRHWAEALAGRAQEPATVLVLGDSISEGLRASSLERRWLDLLQAEVRLRFPTAGIGAGGGPGYLAAYHSSGPPGGPTTSGAVTRTSQRGPGYRAVSLGEGGSVTYRGVVGTTARVWYSSVAFGGPLRVGVDGGAPVSVPTADGRASYHDRWVDVPLGASGPHDIEIRRGVGGFDPTFAGIQGFDGDEEVGVQVLDAARSGALASRFAAGATGGSAQVSDLEDWVAGAGADLAVVALGVNEWQTDVSPSAFEADLHTIVDNLRLAAPQLPVLVVAWYEPHESYAGEVAWSEYVAVMRRLVAGEADVVLVDFSTAAGWPRPTTIAPDGRYADGIHPSDAGHAAIARELADLLARGRPRPDLRLRRGVRGPLVGDDVYNLTTRHQRRHALVRRGHGAAFVLSIQNDAAHPDRLLVAGDPSTRSVGVRFGAGGRDVTTAVVQGRYRTPLLAPGGRHAVVVRVRVTPRARPGAEVGRSVRVRSWADPRLADHGRILVEVR